MTTYYLDGTATGTADGLSLVNAFTTPAQLEAAWGIGDECEVVGGQTYTLTNSIDMPSGATLRHYQGVTPTSKPIFDANDGAFDGCSIDGVTAHLLGVIFQNAGSSYHGLRFANAVDGSTVIDCGFHDNGVNGVGANNTATGTVSLIAVEADDNGQGGTGDGIGQRGASIFNCWYCVTRRNAGGTGSSDGYTSHDTGAINLHACRSIDDGDAIHITGSGTHTIENFRAIRPTERILDVNAAATVTANGLIGDCSYDQGVMVRTGGVLNLRNAHLQLNTDAPANSELVQCLDGSLFMDNVSLKNYCSTGRTTSVNIRSSAVAATIRNLISYIDPAADSTSYHIWSEFASATSDYSTFNDDTGNRFRYINTTYDFAGWQGLSADANSQIADPLFETTAEATEIGLIDARVLAGSPTRGAGTNLYGTFTDDLNGLPRPGVGDWDQGPIEYQGLALVESGGFVSSVQTGWGF